MDRAFTAQARSQTTRLERRSLGDDAYSALRKMIVQGQLAPGEKLVESTLAALLGISRTPVREALQRLEYEGWVATQPGRSPRVSMMTVKKAEEVYPLIAALEVLAVRQALAHLTGEDLRRMEELTEAMGRHGRRGEVERFMTAHAEFHAIVDRASRNERLQRYAQDLRGQMERLEYTLFSEPAALKATLAWHRKLVRLLRHRNVRAAQRAVEQQWEHDQHAVIAILRGPKREWLNEENERPSGRRRRASPSARFSRTGK